MGSRLSLVHGIIVDMASLMPAHPGAGGYSVAPGGYLNASTAEALTEMARVPQQSDRAYIADFARMSDTIAFASFATSVDASTVRAAQESPHCDCSEKWCG